MGPFFLAETGLASVYFLSMSQQKNKKKEKKQRRTRDSNLWTSQFTAAVLTTELYNRQFRYTYLNIYSKKSKIGMFTKIIRDVIQLRSASGNQEQAHPAQPTTLVPAAIFPRRESQIVDRFRSNAFHQWQRERSRTFSWWPPRNSLDAADDLILCYRAADRSSLWRSSLHTATRLTIDCRGDRAHQVGGRLIKKVEARNMSSLTSHESITSYLSLTIPHKAHLHKQWAKVWTLTVFRRYLCLSSI